MFKQVGSLITVEVPVSDPDAVLQGASITDIIARPTGGFTIAYRVTINDILTTSSNLYLRSYDATGQALSDSVSIDSSNSVAQAFFGRFGAYDSDGVVLFGQRSDTTTFSLREYGPTGVLLDGPDPIIPSLTASTFVTDGIGLSGGRSFLLYQDDFGGDTLLRGRIFNDDNTPAGAVIALSDLDGVDQTYSVGDKLANDKLVIAYSQSGGGDTGDIYAMIRTSDGAPDTTAFRVNTQTSGRQYDTDIAALSSGQFVVAWTSVGSGFENVFVRVYDEDGQASTKALQVSKGTATYQNNPEVVAISGGRFAVIWENSHAQGEIKAQLYDRLGDRIGGETILTRSAAPSYYDQSPRAAEISNGVLALAWTRDIEQEGILARRFDVGKAGTDGNDTLDAARLGHVLEGLAGNDTLLGGGGQDLLIGGAGRDRMTGNGKADQFIFASTDDMGASKATRDIVTDFDTRADRLNLKAIDAIDGGDDDAFAFIKAGKFTGAEGQLHFLYSGKTTIVEGDIDGDKQADFQIELSGHLKLTAQDFIL